MEGGKSFPKLNNYMTKTGIGQTANANSHIQAKKNRQKEVVELLCKENKKISLKNRPVSCMAEIKAGMKILGQPLKIYPDEVIFKDININQSYEINIMVRNISKIAKRIRIVQPKTSKFRVDYDMTGPLAPGIAVELIVSFVTNNIGDFHDKITVFTDDDLSFDIPLHSYAPTANI